MSAYSNKIQTMIFDRSNPHEVVAIAPKGHKDYPDGKKFTRIDELREKGFERNDLAMVNVWGVDEIYDQWCVYGTKSGKLVWDNNCKLFFTREERKQIQEIVNRILEASKEFPEMLNLLMND